MSEYKYRQYRHHAITLFAAYYTAIRLLVSMAGAYATVCHRRWFLRHATPATHATPHIGYVSYHVAPALALAIS